MYSLQQIASVEQIVRKSRFLATAGPIQDERTARAFIDAHAVSEASHNCWAWRIGQAYRFSDDGEPGGSAGRPILQAIDTQSIDNVAVVVTRWFGGILLGTGGLARAYGGTAAQCLRSATLAEIVRRRDVRMKVGFSDIGLVKARLGAVDGVQITTEVFVDGGAEIAVSVPENAFEATIRRLTDATSGRIGFLGSDQ